MTVKVMAVGSISTQGMSYFDFFALIRAQPGVEFCTQQSRKLNRNWNEVSQH